MGYRYPVRDGHGEYVLNEQRSNLTSNALTDDQRGGVKVMNFWPRQARLSNNYDLSLGRTPSGP